MNTILQPTALTGGWLTWNIFSERHCTWSTLLNQKPIDTIEFQREEEPGTGQGLLQYISYIVVFLLPSVPELHHSPNLGFPQVPHTSQGTHQLDAPYMSSVPSCTAIPLNVVLPSSCSSNDPRGFFSWTCPYKVILFLCIQGGAMHGNTVIDSIIFPGAIHWNPELNWQEPWFLLLCPRSGKEQHKGSLRSFPGVWKKGVAYS